MNEVTSGDSFQRERALDVRCSFIVQAPAGSGKTELLIQRMLALLATVEAPEEVVAITFTRKAAGEMRERIQSALASADAAAPSVEHRRKTWLLARAAHQHAIEAGWDLEENPSRLRIHTIDALCANLARQMPMLSRFGTLPAVVEDAAALYREAARRVLASLEGDDEAALAVSRLLAHLDNDVQVAQSLLARMLGQRDQWLRHVARRHTPRLERATLEAGVQRLIGDELKRLVSLVPAAWVHEWLAVARFAGINVSKVAPADPLAALSRLTAMPGVAPEDLDTWRALAGLVLTKEGDARLRLDVNCGFPASSGEKDRTVSAALKQWKVRATTLIDALCGQPGLRRALHATRMLPEPRYTEQQWNALQALVAILPLAVAHLQLLFRERRQSDFSALAAGALRALGEDEAPTDLALALDYRIRHLLVDEFQDTSHTQFELLERLTAGWQPGDGRTLFVVGDPMQSIYRFREAEVALYLRARRQGIGNVPLEPITLSTNFRSQARVIEWVNQTFPLLLPRVEDLASGGVTFAPSDAARPPLSGPAVIVHPVPGNDRAGEAARTVELVRAALEDVSVTSVAILVRNRSHLLALVPALKRAGLQPHAVEIDVLGKRSVISDLHALTRALLHAGDRVAWLAILRAPWCGLTLGDLDALARDDRAATIVDLLSRDEVLRRVSEDGQRRLRRLVPVLVSALANRRRGSAARCVEGVWLQLGGPATLRDEAELDDARAFFDLLTELDEGGDVPDFGMLAARIAQLYAAAAADADPRLQVMTIHKAKGLEFDVVVLPGLGYAPRRADAQLLMWLEREWQGGSDLLLAPMKGRTGDDERLCGYLAQLDAMKTKNEDARLLYVAVTRARRAVHLLGDYLRNNDQPLPRPNSLLACLWPAVETHYRAACSADASAPGGEQAASLPPAMILRRLPLDWRPPQPAPGIGARAASSSLLPADQSVEFSWASETARHSGSVVHAFLERIARDGLDAWNPARVRRMEAQLERDLRSLGVPPHQLPLAVQRVVHALTNALDDARARWMLAAQREAQCELALTADLDGEMTNVVIDRTFVDDAGTRWIIDYKTGMHQGGDVDAFLDRERLRYREQLERYARVMKRIDPRPIKLALYFPLLSAWREWDAADSPDA